MRFEMSARWLTFDVQNSAFTSCDRFVIICWNCKWKFVRIKWIGKCWMKNDWMEFRTIFLRIIGVEMFIRRDIESMTLIDLILIYFARSLKSTIGLSSICDLCAKCIWTPRKKKMPLPLSWSSSNRNIPTNCRLLLLLLFV